MNGSKCIRETKILGSHGASDGVTKSELTYKQTDFANVRNKSRVYGKAHEGDCFFVVVKTKHH